MPELDKTNLFFFPFVRKLCQAMCIISSAYLEPTFHIVDSKKFFIKAFQKKIWIIKIVKYNHR